jgi:hypothetical protein
MTVIVHHRDRYHGDRAVTVTVTVTVAVTGTVTV